MPNEIRFCQIHVAWLLGGRWWGNSTLFELFKGQISEGNQASSRPDNTSQKLLPYSNNQATCFVLSFGDVWTCRRVTTRPLGQAAWSLATGAGQVFDARSIGILRARPCSAGRCSCKNTRSLILLGNLYIYIYIVNILVCHLYILTLATCLPVYLFFCFVLCSVSCFRHVLLV